MSKTSFRARATAAPAAPDLEQQNVVAAIDGLEDAHASIGKHKATVGRYVENVTRALETEKQRHIESIESAQLAFAAAEERHAAEAQKARSERDLIVAKLEGENKMLSRQLAESRTARAQAKSLLEEAEQRARSYDPKF